MIADEPEQLTEAGRPHASVVSSTWLSIAVVLTKARTMHRNSPQNHAVVNRKTYDSLAIAYDSRVKERKRHNDFILTRFSNHIVSGRRVLDVGCAVGLDVYLFTKKGFSVVGIDISEEMIGIARARNPESEIIQGDFCKNVFDRPFDAIYAQSFIHLFPKSVSKALLMRMHSLLVPDGVIHVTSTTSERNTEGWYPKSDYPGSLLRFRSYWTPDEMRYAIVNSGFKILDAYVIKDPYDKEMMIFDAAKQLTSQ